MHKPFNMKLVAESDDAQLERFSLIADSEM